MKCLATIALLSVAAFVNASSVAAGPVLRLTSEPPGAVVTLVGADGKRFEVPEKTPALFDVLAGRYRVRFELPGFPSREEIVEVSADAAQIPCAVAWPTGELRLVTTQPGIEVEIHRGESLTDETRLTTVTLPLHEPLRVPAGKISLRAHADGHWRRDVTGASAITVEPGGVARVVVWLRPLKTLFDRRDLGWDIATSFADLDGDGLPEVLVMRRSSGEAVAIRSDGTERIVRHLDEWSSALSAADVYGDGQEELLLGKESVGVVAKSIDGSERTMFQTDASPTVIGAGDFDGDGSIEIVVAFGSSNPREARIAVFHADGSKLFEVPFAGGAYGVQPCDLDGDGKKELVMHTGGAGIVAYSLDGTRCFEKNPRAMPSLCGIGDLDGDRKDEVVIEASSEIVAYEGDGSVRVRSKSPSVPQSLLVADLDGDGRCEIAHGTVSGDVVVTSGDGSPRFQTNVHDYVSCLAAADLDGDGKAELIAGTIVGRLFAFDAEGHEMFEIHTWGRPEQLAARDLDGDGRPELLVKTMAGQVAAFGLDVTLVEEAPLPEARHVRRDSTDESDMAESRLEGSKEGEIREISVDATERVVAKAPSTAWQAERVDVGGRPLILAQGTRGQLFGFDESGKLLFTTDLGAIHCVFVADVDGDGKNEIVATAHVGKLMRGRDGDEGSMGWSSADPCQVFVLNADGSVRWKADIEGEIWSKVLVADVDGDGRNEIVAAVEPKDRFSLNDEEEDGAPPRAKNEIVILRADGTIWQHRPIGGHPNALVAVDLDGDGKPEPVIGTGDGRILSLGRDGTIARTIQIHGVTPIAGGGDFFSGIQSLRFADLDGDGRAEILVNLGIPQHVAVLESDGTTRFEVDLRGQTGEPAVGRLAAGPAQTIALGGYDGRLAVVDAHGSRILNSVRPTDSTRVRTRSGDEGMVRVFGADHVLASYRPDPNDPRPRLKRRFLESLDAAETGREADAAKGFGEAKLRWLAFDDSGIASIRARLTICDSSLSAKRILGVFDRVRPAIGTEWQEALESFVAAGRIDRALAFARKSLATASLTRRDATRLGFIAGSIRGDVADARELRLLLSEAAVAATNRRAWYSLVALADALLANGRRDDAIRVGEEALAASGDDPRTRKRVEAALKRYRATSEKIDDKH
ncbi:MAG: VCBS repeat-containing protein [Planctomycetes bacterium]|nr:VCBS repeat-containing protein [Planctomycetota bacterium]